MRRGFLVPLGIGIVISAILMNLNYAVKSSYNIEKKARQMGMVYPDEIRVINSETGSGKND